MKTHLTLVLIFFISLSCFAEDITGQWYGLLKANGVKLRVVFNIEKDDSGKEICTLDSPDQGAKGIHAVVTRYGSDSLKIEIPSIAAYYTGKINKEKDIEGKFFQSGMTYYFDLSQKKITLYSDQTPKPPFSYKTEEVSFTNTEDSVVLQGTLTYPRKYENMNRKTVPVVIMIGGSGRHNRDKDIFGHKPFLVIADYFAKNGIATLRYDDRGIGYSTGEGDNVTTYTKMKDALAGIEYLKKTHKFGKIGVLGHSEGGTIAFMIAAREKAKFIISLAGTAVRGDEVLLDQNKSLFLVDGVSEKSADEYCDILREIFNYKIEFGSIENPQEFVSDAIQKKEYDLPVSYTNNLKKVAEIENKWIDYFIAFDPSEDISKVNCPVFAVGGTKDLQVSSKININRIRELLPSNKYNFINEYNGLNHLFQPCETGKITEYSDIEQTFCPQVMMDICGWIETINK